MRSSFILLVFISVGAFAQQDFSERWSVDGKIINSTNKEPVYARIVYESLPYGGSIGFLNGDSFSFFIPKESEYNLKVEAEGYATYTYNIKPEEFREGRYFTTIELVPTSANRLIRLEKLIFDVGEARITSESFEELNSIAQMMLNNPKMIVQLEGHTDYQGNGKLNMKLSEERVHAVKQYLVGRGIEKRRVKTKAFGGSEPIIKDVDPKLRERNRRVEVRILSNQ